MDRTLKKMNITRKKDAYDPTKETERVKKLTKEYIEDIESESIEKCIFIDESGSVLNMTCHMGEA